MTFSWCVWFYTNCTKKYSGKPALKIISKDIIASEKMIYFLEICESFFFYALISVQCLREGVLLKHVETLTQFKYADVLLYQITLIKMEKIGSMSSSSFATSSNYHQCIFKLRPPYCTNTSSLPALLFAEQQDSTAVLIYFFLLLWIMLNYFK